MNALNEMNEMNSQFYGWYDSSITLPHDSVVTLVVLVVFLLAGGLIYWVCHE